MNREHSKSFDALNLLTPSTKRPYSTSNHNHHDHGDMGTVLLCLSLVVLAVPLYPFFVKPIGPIRFTASFVSITWSYLSNRLEGPELPPPLFWILLVLLLPTTLRPFCWANLLLYSLLLTNSHQLTVFIWLVICFVIPITSACQGRLHLRALVGWFPVSIYFLKEIQFRGDIIYMLTWYNVLVSLHSFIPDEMPFVWSIACTIIAMLLESLIRPWETYVRYVLFSAALNLLAFPMTLFPWLFIYPELYLFPFNMISDHFKLSSTRWYPASNRPNGPQDLCPQCQQLTENSKLLMGSRFPLIKFREWHDVFVERTHLTSSPPCHLCHLLWLWYAVDVQKDSQDPVSSVWRVKIWEQRPFTRFKFIRLYRGLNPAGPRLLIYAGNLFPRQSESLGFSDTGSHGSIAQAKSWLRSCQSDHELCGKTSGSSPRKLPTRLVCVLPCPGDEMVNGSHTAKLVEVDPSDNTIQYLAFSHRWGNTHSFLLQEANYEACLQHIDTKILCKNVSQALQVTKDLGFSYIWIDTLCIKQDSPEDWSVEAAKMGEVYAGAVCTLASTSSENDEGGLFHQRNPLCFQPCRIGVSSLDEPHPESLYIRLDDLANFRQCVDAAPLNKRGWVMQERLLSRRILHFASELLYWECCQRAASELNPIGFVYKEYPQEFYGNFIPPPIPIDPIEPETLPIWSRAEVIRRRIPAPDLFHDSFWQGTGGFWKEHRRHSHLPWSQDNHRSRFRTSLDRLESIGYCDNLDAGMLDISHLWYEIVEGYTRTQLTYPSDRLVAISGIMQRVEKATQVHFAFGLLTGEHIIVNLLWFIQQGPGKRVCFPQAGSSNDGDDHLKPSASTFPTWSWASVDAPVTLNLLPDNANRGVTRMELASAVINTGHIEPTLELEGPFSELRKVEQVGDEWFIMTEGLWRGSAKLYPDLALFEKHMDDGITLFCIACIVLKRETEMGVLKVWRRRTEVQGLVLRRLVERSDIGQPDIFERVGFFTTRQRGFTCHKSFRDMKIKVIHLQ